MVASAVSTPGLGRHFWRMFASSTTSNLADGVGRAALPLLAASLTRDPFLISALTAQAYLPWLLFGLMAGVAIDRVDRRRTMVVANGFRAVLFGGLGLAVLAHAATIELVYVVAFAAGTAETVYESAARAALPQLVRRDQLEVGNGRLFTGEVVGQSFVGAPLGSLLFAALTAAPLLANGFGFAVAALLVVWIGRDIRPPRQHRGSLRADLAEGMRWLYRNRLIRGLTLLTAVTAITFSMASAIQVLYVLQDLRLPTAGYGLIVAAAGAGSAAGGILAALIRRRFGRTATFVGAMLVSGTATLAIGYTTLPVLAGLLFALISMAFVVGDVQSLSLRQALVPPEMFGRVQGVYRTLVWGAFPVGALAGGALAAQTNVPTVYRTSGMVHVIVSLCVWRLVRAHRTEINTAFSVEPKS